MPEKRLHQRSAIELAASFGIGEDSLNTSGATITNMSVGGFSFSSEQKLKIGQVIDLCVELEPNKNITVPVKVMWVQKMEDGSFIYGVQIIDTSSADLQQFITFYNDQTHQG